MEAIQAELVTLRQELIAERQARQQLQQVLEANNAGIVQAAAQVVVDPQTSKH